MAAVKSAPSGVPCASGFWVPPAGRALGSGFRMFRAMGCVGSVGSAIQRGIFMGGVSSKHQKEVALCGPVALGWPA